MQVCRVQCKNKGLLLAMLYLCDECICITRSPQRCRLILEGESFWISCHTWN